MKTGHVALILSIVALTLVCINAFYTVHGGDVAILTQSGKIVGQTNEPGLHVKIPFLQTDHHYTTDRLYQWTHDPYRVLTVGKKQVDVYPSAQWKITDPIRFHQTIRSIPRANRRLAEIVSTAIRDSISSRNRDDIVEMNRLEAAQPSGKQAVVNEVVDFSASRLNAFGIEMIRFDMVVTDRNG